MPLISSFDPWSSTLCTCPPKLTFNPYTGCDHGCVYCYASSYIPNFFACRPKKNLLHRLKQEGGKLRGEIISISNSSDPYPNIEAERRLMRECLKIISQSDCKIQIITKSTIVVRDTDILCNTICTVAITITTESEKTASIIEPKAPSPYERLKTIRTLADMGIPVSVRIDPIIPYVNDNPKTLISQLADMSIKHITASTYKIKPDNWRRLSLAMPELARRLYPLYYKYGEKKSGYVLLPTELRSRILKNIRELATTNGMKFGVCRENLPHLNTAPCDGSWMFHAKKS